MTSDKYKHYLCDLGMLLKEKALIAKVDKDGGCSDYNVGYLMAYHEVISLMKQQADFFDIRQNEINLEGIEPLIDVL